MRRFSLALLLACCTAPGLSAQAKKPANLPEGTRVERDLAYGDHERQKLDVFLPAKSDNALPLIVWIHGGAWSAGSKDVLYFFSIVQYCLIHLCSTSEIGRCKVGAWWQYFHACYHRRYGVVPNDLP